MNSKIITLIPAFRTDFLDSVFYGLSTQTYKNFRVIVADDSTNGIVSEYIRSGKYNEYTSKLDISIIEGAGSEPRNHNLLLKAWDGNTELAHFHHDDDYLYPDFYRQHVIVHDNLDITLSASSRWIADREGKPLAYSQTPLELSQSNERYSLLKPNYLAKSLLVSVRNWIGEFSNVVMSNDILKFIPSLPAIHQSYWGMQDMSLYLTNCKHGNNFGYIRDHLSVYRSPIPGIAYRNPNTLLGKLIRFAWVAYTVQAWEDNMLSDEDFVTALSNSLRAYAVSIPPDDMMNCLADNISMANGNYRTIADHVNSAWSILRSDYDYSATEGPLR